jgi:Zn-finger protein
MILQTFSLYRFTIKSAFQLLEELGTETLNCCWHPCHFPPSAFVFYATLFYILIVSSGGFFKREGKAKDHEVYYKNL